LRVIRRFHISTVFGKLLVPACPAYPRCQPGKSEQVVGGPDCQTGLADLPAAHVTTPPRASSGLAPAKDLLGPLASSLCISIPLGAWRRRAHFRASAATDVPRMAPFRIGSSGTTCSAASSSCRNGPASYPLSAASVLGLRRWRAAGATAVLNRSYEVFARTCGFEIDPCRPATGSDKGKAERRPGDRAPSPSYPFHAGPGPGPLRG
jgi:hypothetical protein